MVFDKLTIIHPEPVEGYSYLIDLKYRIFMKIMRSLVLASLIFSPVIADIPLLKLDDTAIAQEKTRIARDFTQRNYVAKASYAMLGAGSLWFAYKWGLFDFILGNKVEDLPVLPEDSVQVTHEKLLPLVTALLQHAKDQSKKIEKLETKNLEGKMHWLIEGAKYVGLTGFSILGGIVVQSKWQNLFNYALAEPTFDWFYGSHSMLNRIDSLRYHIANSIDATGATPQASLDFHHDAIAPTLDTVHKNLKELIAFSEYYFDNLDAAIVAQYNLDGAPRYLFNTTNDFFDAVKKAVDAQDRAKALALTDAFRAELTNYNKDCQSFENTLLN
jgi:hypothetical protein